MLSISSLENAMFRPGAYKLLVFCFSVENGLESKGHPQDAPGSLG